MILLFIISLAVIFVVIFSCGDGCESMTASHKKSGFSDSELDDELEDCGRIFDDTF